MATKRSGKAKKAAKNRSKRIPSVKRLNEVRPLLAPRGPGATEGDGPTLIPVSTACVRITG
jgi:hypothetical protein